MQYAWTCACCGRQYSTLPMDYGCAAPDYWRDGPEAERDERSKLSADFCKIEDRDYFIRGVIQVPVIGTKDFFGWGVWTSLSLDSFTRAGEIWNDDVVENEPPRFGWLSNQIKIYPSTLSLKTLVHFRGGRLRPRIELEPTDHPLAVEQRQGISIERVQEIAAALLHRH